MYGYNISSTAWNVFCNLGLSIRPSCIRHVCMMQHCRVDFHNASV